MIALKRLQGSRGHCDIYCVASLEFVLGMLLRAISSILLIALKRHLLGPPCQVLICIVP